MEFSPNNSIVKLCIQGMAKDDGGRPEAAREVFLQAWNEATDNFEKFLAAHFVARHQDEAFERLRWHERSVQYALAADDPAARSALSTLYSNIAKCWEDLGDTDRAKMNLDLANALSGEPSDPGPFFHGTKADLGVGDLLTAGGESNYQADLRMNHVYFTALPNTAGLAAALAKGDGPERVYVVEPTGPFENDPNVTDKKFPGNLTRSYRSAMPLKIIGEVTDWTKQTSENLKEWREKLANSKGEILN